VEQPTYSNKRKKEFERILEMLDEGQKILVEFHSQSWEEGYLNKGMRAHLVSYGDTDVYEMSKIMQDEGLEDDSVTQLEFDFTEFLKYNQNHEISGNMDDIAIFNENGFEVCFLSQGYFDLPFKIITDKNPYFKRYSKSESNLTYTQWLELQLKKCS